MDRRCSNGSAEGGHVVAMGAAVYCRGFDSTKFRYQLFQNRRRTCDHRNPSGGSKHTPDDPAGGAVTAGTGAEAGRWDEQRHHARSRTLRPLRPGQRRSRNKIGDRERTGGPGEPATEAARDLRDK
ncbi:hypothetical protein NDU88_004739 [Pleurodeles waltl]|uniref:Uncharacterized protein n=1 Tax=Pleurodeles waltl TaxID=8319 RepID=A0AAV7W8R1_PLEWA|nr:hypothetical protein NDU88_004739 [Pleurodeles waltl]